MEEIFLDKVDSTQDYAKELILNGKDNFTVFARVQEYGRGRRERHWFSKEGGLWFSFDIDFNNASDLFTMAIGVAVREVCFRNYGYNIKLKWPNDIIIDGKKVGGILCERIGNKVIVGVGINTNIENAGCDNSTTFFSATGKCIDNKELMREIIKESRKIIDNNFCDVINEFRENMAFKNEMCYVSTLDTVAKILDVTDNGHLIVSIDDIKKEVFTGEINLCI